MVSDSAHALNFDWAPHLEQNKKKPLNLSQNVLINIANIMDIILWRFKIINIPYFGVTKDYVSDMTLAT